MTDSRATDTGQATLEFLAAIPVLVACALVALQLLAAGYTMSLADGAAEAGALASAAGRPVRTAVRHALPGWAREAAKVVVRAGSVEVTLATPSPAAKLSRALRMRSDAPVRSAPK